MIHLTPHEEELVRNYRLNRKIDGAFNSGLETAAQVAEAWSREGGGVQVLDNFARSIRTRMIPVREEL